MLLVWRLVLLSEKFAQIDWLRAEVFELNWTYLVTMGTKMM